jgi:hypothetical protein
MWPWMMLFQPAWIYRAPDRHTFRAPCSRGEDRPEVGAPDLQVGRVVDAVELWSDREPWPSRCNRTGPNPYDRWVARGRS